MVFSGHNPSQTIAYKKIKKILPKMRAISHLFQINIVLLRETTKTNDKYGNIREEKQRDKGESWKEVGEREEGEQDAGSSKEIERKHHC